jgi:hypothetical protein
MDSSRGSSSSRLALLAAATITLAAAAFAVTTVRKENRVLQARVLKAEKLRGEERRGRTTAEIALRRARREDKEAASASQSTSFKDNIPFTLTLPPIGFLHSPFKMRSGTPRQGGAVPACRGFIELCTSRVQQQTLDGLSEYSHAWVIFTFHANTDEENEKPKKAKVSPPRAPKGKKYGR